MHQRPIRHHHCCPECLMLITKQKDVVGGANLIIILPSKCCIYPWAIAPCLMQHMLSSVHPGFSRLLLLIVLDNIQSSQSSNTTTIAISPQSVLTRSWICHHSWLVSLKVVIMGAIAQTHSPRVVVADVHDHTQQKLLWLTCTHTLLELLWLTCTNTL